jgi:hypothetical protein
MAFHNYCHMLLIIKSNLDTMLKDTVQGWIYQEVGIILEATYQNYSKKSRLLKNKGLWYWPKISELRWRFGYLQYRGDSWNLENKWDPAIRGIIYESPWWQCMQSPLCIKWVVKMTGMKVTLEYSIKWV